MTRPVRILFAFALLTALSTGPSLSTMAADRSVSESTPPPNPVAVIRGEIARPGRYELREGETLSSLILRAGGYTDNAWLPGAVLVRKAERDRQAEELAGIAAGISAAMRKEPPGEADPASLRRFLEALRDLSPSGRIPVRLDHPRLMINSPQDFALTDGDDLFIPSLPSTVRVAGAVNAPGEYPDVPGARPSGVIASAGGFLPDADRDGAFLLKADGTARPLHEGWAAWNEDAGRWELSLFRKDRPRIEPGDTIFVPRDPGRMRWPGGIEEYRRTMMRILEIAGPWILP